MSVISADAPQMEDYADFFHGFMGDNSVTAVSRGTANAESKPTEDGAISSAGTQRTLDPTESRRRSINSRSNLNNYQNGSTTGRNSFREQHQQASEQRRLSIKNASEPDTADQVSTGEKQRSFHPLSVGTSDIKRSNTAATLVSAQQIDIAMPDLDRVGAIDTQSVHTVYVPFPSVHEATEEHKKTTHKPYPIQQLSVTRRRRSSAGSGGSGSDAVATPSPKDGSATKRKTSDVQSSASSSGDHQITSETRAASHASRRGSRKDYPINQLFRRSSKTTAE